MSATLAAALPRGADWSYEVKWDGYRALLVHDGGRVRIVSRNLKDLTADYPQIAAAAPSLSAQPFLLDGEIVALDVEGKPSFQALQHRSVKRSGVVYYAFDLLQFGAADLRARSLQQRRRALAQMRFGVPIILSAPLPGTPEQIEQVVREAGLEGVVAKRLTSTYQAGLRSRDWVKVKFNARQEFVIGGYKPGGNTFDSVLAGYYEARRFFYAGKVRAGFTPRTRAEIWSRLHGRELRRCPFSNLPNSTGKSHWGEGITADDMDTLRWVRPEIVMEVSFVEWTAGGNLRHASFAGLRSDKLPRDVHRRA